jgi:hypothetical protein
VMSRGGCARQPLLIDVAAGSEGGEFIDARLARDAAAGSEQRQ